MSLEMPDVETEDQKKERKKAAQAAAHKKWRQSEKYAIQTAPEGKESAE
jgi:hypothetical protein